MCERLSFQNYSGLSVLLRDIQKLMLEVRGVGMGVSKLGEAILLVLLEHRVQESSILYKQNHS